MPRTSAEVIATEVHHSLSGVPVTVEVYLPHLPGSTKDVEHVCIKYGRGTQIGRVLHYPLSDVCVPKMLEVFQLFLEDREPCNGRLIRKRNNDAEVEEDEEEVGNSEEET